MELRPNANTIPNTPRTVDTPGPAASNAAAGTGAPASADAVEKSSPQPDKQQLDEAMTSINKSMRALNNQIEFTVDPESDRTIVKVVDQRTQEVIRQMPSVETLEIAKALDRVQGLLIRQTA